MVQGQWLSYSKGSMATCLLRYKNRACLTLKKIYYLLNMVNMRAYENIYHTSLVTLIPLKWVWKWSLMICIEYASSANRVLITLAGSQPIWLTDNKIILKGFSDCCRLRSSWGVLMLISHRSFTKSNSIKIVACWSNYLLWFLQHFIVDLACEDN